MLTVSLDAPGSVRLNLDGHLDDPAVREVLHLAADAVRCGCTTLVLDLDRLVSFDDGGATAVVGCCALAPWLPGGVELIADSEVARALVRSAWGADEGIMATCPAY